MYWCTCCTSSTPVIAARDSDVVGDHAADIPASLSAAITSIVPSMNSTDQLIRCSRGRR